MYRLALRAFRPLLLKTMDMRRTQLEQFPVPTGRVVFLGDSITEQGVWNEWFPELPTLNRGIGSDTIGGVLARLDHAVHQPAAISLLIGTNDLSGLGTSTKVPDIARQMRDLVGRIRELAPTAPLIVNSVMPRQRAYASRVRELNEHYRAIADGADATYVDLWPTLADGGGALKAAFTADNLHLNGAGYRAWVEVLRPAVDRAITSSRTPAAGAADPAR
jgi:lysophospholipase L1-like esterase